MFLLFNNLTQLQVKSCAFKAVIKYNVFQWDQIDELKTWFALLINFYANLLKLSVSNMLLINNITEMINELFKDILRTCIIKFKNVL